MIAVAISCVLILLLIGLILAPLVWIWNVYDAYTLAEQINKGAIAA